MGAARAPPRVTAGQDQHCYIFLLGGGTAASCTLVLPLHRESHAGAAEARKSLSSDGQGRQQHWHSRSLLRTDRGLSETSLVLQVFAVHPNKDVRTEGAREAKPATAQESTCSAARQNRVLLARSHVVLAMCNDILIPACLTYLDQ